MRLLKFFSFWSIPLLVSIGALAIWLGGHTMESRFRYERALVLDGEMYRLLSGNFAHLNGTHLALNLAGLALVWLLVGRRATLIQWVVGCSISLISVGIGLLLFAPETHWYVGLSGLLHGLAVAGGLQGPNRHWFLIGLIAAKLAWEQLFQPTNALLIDSAVVIDAHLFGALGGLLATWPMAKLARTGESPKPTQASGSDSNG
jgi:rhomboid family GlyGly-CTERM serine protease